MNIDEKYMKMAIALAKKAEGFTSPNPMVGAVIVKKGRVIGKGYHRMCGLPHAEVNALADAGSMAAGATMYVNLEPCDHFGRTSPCTEAVIKGGIRKVVIAMKDPNPINNGRGIKKLNQNGIKTIIGVLEDDAACLNRAYVKFITKRMPYVTVKIAESIDGKIATRTGESKWITSEDARQYVHELRSRNDAVMVGVNTVIRDDPLLLSRMPGAKQPVRVIVDSRFRTPKNAKLFSSAARSPVIIATVNKGKRPDASARVNLRALLKELAGMGIASVLVEGGGEVVASLVEDRLADRFLFFISPRIIGGRDAVTSVEGRGIARLKEAMELKDVRIRRFSRDILVEAEAH
jgi:diaminohydroxyphosphoribosylaminopyrimidine deaminase / 5-amino-6-(5-phosphoribosylamino)uracil reductase